MTKYDADDPANLFTGFAFVLAIYGAVRLLWLGVRWIAGVL